MKKRWMMVPVLALGAALLCSCGKKDSKTDYGNYVTLGDYKNLSVTAQQTEFTDEDIEIQTKQMYFYYVQAQDGVKDRPVQNLDMTNIDYEGKKDGVAFEGGTAQGATLLIGSDSFIDGFEEGLIGVMPGETVDLNLTFPDGYQNEELAGQQVVFTVTVNFIPEMEDEHVSELNVEGVDTVDELRTYVRERLEDQARSAYLDALGSEIMTQIIADAQFEELPKELLEENRQTYLDWLEDVASEYGMTAEDYLKMYGMDYESTLDQYAEEYTKEILVVHAIADKEGLNISDEALEARLEEFARDKGVAVDELMVGDLTLEDYKESFLYEDVVTFLAQQATGGEAGAED